MERCVLRVDLQSTVGNGGYQRKGRLYWIPFVIQTNCLKVDKVSCQPPWRQCRCVSRISGAVIVDRRGTTMGNLKPSWKLLLARLLSTQWTRFSSSKNGARAISDLLWGKLSLRRTSNSRK